MSLSYSTIFISIFVVVASLGLIYATIPLFQDLWAWHIAGMEKRCRPLIEALRYRWTSRQTQLYYCLGPLLSGLLVLMIIPGLVPKLVIFPLLVLVTYRLPKTILAFLKKRRIGAIQKQLPDALSLVSNTLRSGLSLQQGFEMAAEEMVAPIAEEFKIMMSEQRLGKSMDESLALFYERVPTPDVELLVSSLQTLRETGGNLIETMDIIVKTIQEEMKVRSKIKSLTMQGVAQAVVICCLPFGLAFAIYKITPEFILPMFQEYLGWLLIGAMLLLQGIGIFAMKKILTIRV